MNKFAGPPLDRKFNHGDISCLKYHFRQLLSQLKDCMIKSEISVSDLSNFSNLENFGEFWGRTVHPRKLIITINVVQNDISDNLYFDYKAEKSNLTELFF